MPVPDYEYAADKDSDSKVVEVLPVKKYVLQDIFCLEQPLIKVDLPKSLLRAHSLDRGTK